MFKDSVQKLWPFIWDSYRAKIARPMDIGQMERALRSNEYETLGDFVNDVYLIYENSVTFNSVEHDVTLQAKSLMENIFVRMAEVRADEPTKPEKKESKPVPTRHAEPRAAAQQARRESRGAVTSPTTADEVVAVPASGMPIIRRDSTKNEGDRPKRAIHPPKSKELPFEAKGLKKKKSTPEFRFCEEVLKELTRSSNWQANQWFMKPVDPVRDKAPGYHKVIKNPMDLGTMQTKLNSGEYESPKDFEKDFRLIIKNCLKFNGGDGEPNASAQKLEEMFDAKWKTKDSWIAKDATSSVSASGRADTARDESDDEAEASEPEVEEAAPPASSVTLDALNARLTEETQRLTSFLTGGTVPNATLIQTQQSVITMITTQIMEERTRLAEQEKKTKKPAKAKPSKPKKAAQGAAPSSGGKKAAGGSAAATKKSGSGGAKKSSKARVMGQVEKGVVTEGINSLDGSQLERAIDIIKKDTHQEVSFTPLELFLLRPLGRSDVLREMHVTDLLNRRARVVSLSLTSISSLRMPSGSCTT